MNLLPEKTSPTVDELREMLTRLAQENIVLAGRLLLKEWEAKDAAIAADNRLVAHMRKIEWDLNEEELRHSKAAERIREFFKEWEVAYASR